MIAGRSLGWAILASVFGGAAMLSGMSLVQALAILGFVALVCVGLWLVLS